MRGDRIAGFKAFLSTIHRNDFRENPKENKITPLAEKINRISSIVLRPLCRLLTRDDDSELMVTYEKGYDGETERIEVKSLSYKKTWDGKAPRWVIVALRIVFVVLMILPEMIALALKALTLINRQVMENFRWTKEHYREEPTRLNNKVLTKIGDENIENLKKKYEKNRFDRKIKTLIIDAQDMNLNEKSTEENLERLFYSDPESMNPYCHIKVIFNGRGRFVGEENTNEKIGANLMETLLQGSKVLENRLIDKLKGKGFLLKETKFTDNKVSELFQKQFASLEKALNYKPPINPKTGERHGVICIVKEKGRGPWDVIEGKKA